MLPLELFELLSRGRRHTRAVQDQESPSQEEFIRVVDVEDTGAGLHVAPWS